MQEGYDGETRFLQVMLSDIDLTNAESLKSLMFLAQEGRKALYRKIWNYQISDSESASPFVGIKEEESIAYDMPEACPPAAASAFEKNSEIERNVGRQSKESSKKKGLLGRIMGRFSMDEVKCLGLPGNAIIPENREEDLAEEQSLLETEKVLHELRMTVQKLRLEGVSLMAIHEFIDKQEPLSRMTITPDYRIFQNLAVKLFSKVLIAEEYLLSSSNEQ